MKASAILRIGVALMAAVAAFGVMDSARAETDDSVYRIYTLVEPTDLALPNDLKSIDEPADRAVATRKTRARRPA